MATDKLALFNAALRLVGESKLASLTENREPRRLLDDVYDDNAIRKCLNKAHWNFATRSTKIEYDPAIDPDFGYQRGFQKPSDWVRTTTVSSDEYFNNTANFSDEAGYWWADIDTLYVKFVSDGNDYGGDIANWDESFTEYFEAFLAMGIMPKISKDKTLQDRLKLEMKRLIQAGAAKDAQDSGTSFPPEGNWNSARRGRGFGGGRRDGGTRGSLIG